MSVVAACGPLAPAHGVGRERATRFLDMPILLRPLRDADLDALFRWESDPAATAMAAFTREDPTDRAAFDAHYRRIRAIDAVMLRAIELDGVFVGSVGSFDMEGDRELSYWVDPARWGQGIATAGVGAFLELEPQRPLHARTAAHNPRSAAVLARHGFRRVGQERSWSAHLSTMVDEHIHRLD